MKKLLITTVLTSAILAGCGGGGGAGSRSSSALETKYTFQFMQLQEQPEGTATSCTLFDVAGQTEGMQTYAKLAADVTVKTYDKNGDFVQDLSSKVTTAGVLTLTADDVADGGYISIIDSPSDIDKYYKVLSIQKALLGNFIIKVNRPQGDVSCYTGDQVTLNTGYASVTSNGLIVSTYAFDSSQTEIEAAGYTSQEVSAYNDESVLVRAYNGTELSGYAFVSTLKTDEYDDPTALSDADFSTYGWSNSLGSKELTTLSVRLNNGNYSYPWLDATFDSTTGETTAFAYIDADMSWSYSAKGTVSNWGFTYNGSLSDSLDIDVPEELTLYDIKPEITTEGSNVIFDVEGVDSTITRLQRSEYEINRNDDYSTTLNHVIYSKVAGDEDVIIPQLDLEYLGDPATDAKDITVTILSADELTTDLQTFFMYENASADLVSVVLPPSKTVQNNKTKYMGSYTLLNR